MKLEIVLVLVIGLLIYDTYYGGVIVKYWNAFKKYYKLAGIIFLIFSIYITIKKDPSHISKMFMQSMGNTFNKPHMNKHFTDLNGIFNNAPPSAPFKGGEIPTNTCSTPENSVKPTTTKRSVSETKKKFVAYNQQWKCQHCKQMLTAWFEVDHVRRLDQGGSNDVSNLVALCRECHGQKTSIENM
jgi:hypothetical protein